MTAEDLLLLLKERQRVGDLLAELCYQLAVKNSLSLTERDSLGRTVREWDRITWVQAKAPEGK